MLINDSSLWPRTLLAAYPYLFSFGLSWLTVGSLLTVYAQPPHLLSAYLWTSLFALNCFTAASLVLTGNPKFWEQKSSINLLVTAALAALAVELLNWHLIAAPTAFLLLLAFLPFLPDLLINIALAIFMTLLTGEPGKISSSYHLDSSKSK